MSEGPFISLDTESGQRRVLSVPPGWEGFVRHEGGRIHLLPGVHRLSCPHVAAVFLVRVHGSHALELKSLGGAMLRDASGRWSPLKVLGRLVYGVARPDQLADFLEREQIHETRLLERELGRIAVEMLTHVFDGEALHVETLSQNLDVVGGELLRRLTALVLPLGLSLEGLDLLAAPAPLHGVSVPSEIG
jgi:hypothetical protein